jgi:hypothetical protein
MATCCSGRVSRTKAIVLLSIPLVDISMPLVAVHMRWSSNNLGRVMAYVRAVANRYGQVF